MKKEIAAGDHFLLPYAGKKRDLLVRAVAPAYAGFSGHWRVAYLDGRENVVLLSSCKRVQPSEAKRLGAT